MNIELQPHPDKLRMRGGRLIVIDGELWGAIRGESCGPNGMKYFIEDACGHIAQKPTYHSERRGQQYAPVTVWSDKWAKRHDPNAAPLEVRLTQAVEGLITEGLLKPRAKLLAEIAAANAAYQEQMAARDQERDAVFLSKADECLAADDPRAAIVEALRWAQSQ